MPIEDPPRSTLVTRVGRFFLFGSSALIAITLSQLVVLICPAGSLRTGPLQYPGMPKTLIFLAALLLLYALTLSVSLALLKRIAWARPAFIGILGVGVLLNLAKLIFGTLGSDQPELPTEGPAAYLMIMKASTILDALIPLATIVAFVWLILKLNSEPVRDEFGRG